MRIEELRIRGLRCLTNVDIKLEDGINLFVGANGAGKTSVLEAAFLLSHARSFRSSAKEALVQRDSTHVSVFAELIRLDGSKTRVGLGRAGSRWEARADDAQMTLGQLVGQCAVVCFEPGSHALIAGPADERRRYLDWGVFHVEHEFLLLWRRYQRAVKQRNSLLRTSQSPEDDLFAPWEIELDMCATAIDAYRKAYLAQLLPWLQTMAGELLPELGHATLSYRRGWPPETNLLEELRSTRGRDFARGHTTVGCHRADWALTYTHAPIKEHLSRGQEKLTALACVMAQAHVFFESHGEWPVVCLDDLASELDEQHQQAVVAYLENAHAQVLVTGTEPPKALLAAPKAMFHVEQGEITRLL
ncbi:DNA replication/repair protein RecF [Rhodanobacter sp. L36]|uniref:DNA replication/repair protein RecF n=1 Tax=Rhodanobacter sp. L36 TaxID=1747221 RepID=UPI00131B79A3|nr:DNA replication/repair protein RecF [Rhodanobacter sp. L36]